MWGMEMLLVAVLVVVVGAATALVAVELTRRRYGAAAAAELARSTRAEPEVPVDQALLVVFNRQADIATLDTILDVAAALPCRQYIANTEPVI